VFRELLADPVISALCEFLDGGDVSAYAEFVSKFYATGAKSLAEYVMKLAGDDENTYIKAYACGAIVAEELDACVKKELATLQLVADLTYDTLTQQLDGRELLPRFPAGKVNIEEGYRHRAENIGKYGYGMYAKYRMFFIDGDGSIVPVKNPDGTRLSQLVDYKREQQLILDNTRALLEGKPAANILLSGDAGTGKSSTVKAVANELWGEGLRILQVSKEQLRILPSVLDELNENPLKFIIFIDDLSFNRLDDNYSALKAILEGSVSAKADNVVIYATSNRRHMLRESFSDRDGDDVHRNDTMQEIISLSERFGLQITFKKPDKEGYLSIVRKLSRDLGLQLADDELCREAEKFALSRAGRSPRAARQFVNSLAARCDGR